MRAVAVVALLTAGTVARADATVPGGAPAKPETLDKKAIVDGASKAKPAVRACYTEHGVAGIATVAFTIQPDGHPSDIAVRGAFAGTPTATCVVAAFTNNATFPPFTGKPISVVFPFVLR